MTAAPFIAGAAAVVSCALAFHPEHQAGTLESILLTPVSRRRLVLAYMRPGLWAGLGVLAVGIPFYLMPHNLYNGGICHGGRLHPGHVEEAAAFHVLALTAPWRVLLACLGASTPRWVMAERWWLSLFSGPAALAGDAMWLYAAATISAVTSLRTPGAPRAVSIALLKSGLWFLLFEGVRGSLAFVLAFLTMAGGPLWAAGPILSLGILVFTSWLVLLRLLPGHLMPPRRPGQLQPAE
jgi:hypothetical protein